MFRGQPRRHGPWVGYDRIGIFRDVFEIMGTGMEESGWKDGRMEGVRCCSAVALPRVNPG